MAAEAHSMVEIEERDLVEEGKRIATLQSSLQQTTQICQEMIKRLDQFETRVDLLQPTIMPLHRNITSISHMNNNVESTLNVVKILTEKNELAKREEFVLSAGPNLDNLEAYLGSIERVRGGVQSLNAANLGFCRVTVRRLESVGDVAVEALACKYKDWLVEATEAEALASCEDDEAAAEDYQGPSTNEQVKRAALQEGTNSPITDSARLPPANPVVTEGVPEAGTSRGGELCTKLARISEFASLPANSALLQDLLGHYSEVRSKAMMQGLQTLLRGCDTPLRGAYQRGSHPFIRGLREYFFLSNRETCFAESVLPALMAQEAVKRAIKHSAGLVKMSAEGLSLMVIKSIGKHELVDQTWILDVVECSNDMYVAHEVPPAAKEFIAPAIKSVTAAALELLKSLIDDIQSVTKGTVAPRVSTNATVFEHTSSVLNCLKRMLEYERIIEVLLNRWAQPDWDGIVGPINTDYQVFAMALYYQDLLKGLEVMIEKYSHGYKRTMTSVLFQLNNYAYIVRTFKTSNLSSMVTMEAEKKYESIVEALVKEYLLGWRHLIALIEEGATRSAGLPPRDRLKMFSAEFEDIIKDQEKCAIPDPELRLTVIGRIRELLMPACVAFYNTHQTLFIALQSKTKLDPETIESMLNRMYQA